MKTFKKFKTFILTLALLSWFLPTHTFARDEQETQRLFKGKKAVQLNTINGNCIIKSGPGEEIKVRFIHTYSNTKFEPLFNEEGDKLVLREKFHLSDSGDSKWYIWVPNGISIKFTSISGDFSIEGFKGDVRAGTVSGDVVVKECSGNLDLKSVSGDLEVKALSGTINLRGVSSDLKAESLSGEIQVKNANGDVKIVDVDGDLTIKSPLGDIELENASGGFEIKSSSGEIRAKEITFKKESYFKTASGDIYVSLAKALTTDITLDTVSGDAVLNYNGHTMEGIFEFKSKKGSGEIEAPFAFEKEEEVKKWGRTYVLKSFRRDFNKPKIGIYTASGSAVLKKE